MNNTDFMNTYDNYLAHKWITSKDAAKKAEQAKREKEYNAWYYENVTKKGKEEGRAGRSLTREEAAADLDGQQSQFKDSENVADSKKMSDIQRRTLNTRIRKYMDEHPNASLKEATAQVNAEINRDMAERRELDARNRRAARTAQSQASEIQKSAQYKQRQSSYADSIKRAGELNAKSSEAQDRAARTRSNTKAINRRNTSVSNAQENAARARRTATLQKEISARNAAASNAQVDSSKKRSEYQKSTTARVNRVIARSAKKVSNMINTGKAAVQKVTDVYNDTTAKAKKVKNFASMTLRKYFG